MRVREDKDVLVSGERVVPELQADVPWVPQHVVRYEWAAGFIKTGQAVYDVACGAGYGTDILRREAGCPAVGIDYSRAAIDYAADHYPECKFHCTDFFSLAGVMADVTVSFETLEHLEQPINHSLIYLVMHTRRMVIGSVPYREPVGKNPYHLQHQLDESDLGFLRRYGRLRIFFQETCPGVGIRERMLVEDRQNMLFVLEINK